MVQKICWFFFKVTEAFGVVIEMCVKYGGVEVYSTSMVTDVPVLLGRDTRGPKGTGHRGAERHQGERREQQGDRDRRGPQGQRDPTTDTRRTGRDTKEGGWRERQGDRSGPEGRTRPCTGTYRMGTWYVYVFLKRLGCCCCCCC